MDVLRGDFGDDIDDFRSWADRLDHADHGPDGAVGQTEVGGEGDEGHSVARSTIHLNVQACKKYVRAISSKSLSG